ncbi:ABC transporter substrate-binding protein [Paenibacillus rhizoplanae]
MTSLVLTSALVTGCGGNNAANSPAGTAQPGGAASSGLKPYEVVMVFPDAPQNDSQRVQDAMNDYLKKTYPEMNMTVKLNPIDWGAWSDKNEPDDGLRRQNGPAVYSRLARVPATGDQRGLLPLDELLAKYGPDIEAVEKDYHGPAKRGGKLYGIHTHQELGGAQGVYLNKELVDKYNFDLTALKSGKVEELEPMLQTIKENEPGITPLVAPSFPLEAYYSSTNLDSIVSIAAINTVGTAADDYTVINSYTTPRYMELAKLTNKWYKAGYINKDALTPGLDAWKKIQAGKGFAFVSDMDIIADMEIGTAAVSPNGSIKAGREMLQVPLNIDRLQTGKNDSNHVCDCKKSSVDPERAMMLLNLFYKDKELLTLFNFGIEGTHYVLKDGQITLPEGKTTDNVGYYHDIMWQLGNQMLNYTRVGEDPNKYQNYEKFNEQVSSNPSRIFGFVFDPEPVKK